MRKYNTLIAALAQLQSDDFSRHDKRVVSRKSQKVVKLELAR